MQFHEFSFKFPLQISHEGIQLDLQRQLHSGVNSPAAVSSPSCEVRNELAFPALPPTQLQQQQSQEQTKAPPKISQLSELDQQLSKLHNQRTVLAQTQPQPLYTDVVRQSPTTVQQPVAQPPTSGQQVQVPSQAPAQLPTPAPMRKTSRFLISKVPDDLKAQPAAPKSIVSSPESEQQLAIPPQQNVVQSPATQTNQAQMFFQQHHGGVVSLTACP